MVNLELQICITFALSAKVWANTYTVFARYVLIRKSEVNVMV